VQALTEGLEEEVEGVMEAIKMYPSILPIDINNHIQTSPLSTTHLVIRFRILRRRGITKPLSIRRINQGRDQQLRQRSQVSTPQSNTSFHGSRHRSLRHSHLRRMQKSQRNKTFSV
jgi:hypothetical protein